MLIALLNARLAVGLGIWVVRAVLLERHYGVTEAVRRTALPRLICIISSAWTVPIYARPALVSIYAKLVNQEFQFTTIICAIKLVLTAHTPKQEVVCNAQRPAKPVHQQVFVLNADIQTDSAIVLVLIDVPMEHIPPITLMFVQFALTNALHVWAKLYALLAKTIRFYMRVCVLINAQYLISLTLPFNARNARHLVNSAL